VRILLSFIVVCTAVALSPVARAQDATISSSRFSGPADFQSYCASCHGATAKGDGVIAKMLVKRPPDLTLLAKRNNDVFPQDKVFKMIDGRSPGASHPGTDMPIWGEAFAKSTDSPSAEATAARITALVRHLEMIQEKR
jgi:mono/diheme cytochrome c family protein